MTKPVWACAITTVPERRADLFPRTLASVRAAGFPVDLVAVDGEEDAGSWRREFGVGTTARFPRVRTVANWSLTAWEMYYRVPGADYYAIFQDDFVVSAGTREYLEKNPAPRNGYANLYTAMSNEPVVAGKPEGWYEGGLLGKQLRGMDLQTGRGAVALVFPRDVLLTVLTFDTFLLKPRCTNRGFKALDGAVVTAANGAGLREYIHSPSLVQHTGERSAMGNRKHALAKTFRGETWDARELLSVTADNAFGKG